MKPPLIHSRYLRHALQKERGVTMILVAVAMIAMIAMAALSIDLVTLYLAREEAQRAADAAALTAARVLSLTGVTGDPDNLQGSLPRPPWPAACALAQQLAQTVANQNSVGRTAATAVNVTFLYNGTTTDCTNASGGGFAVNPQVQVQVIRQNLPMFFSRIWRRATNSVSATATAEAYNPSDSASLNGMVPVNPRCVKPWLLPNLDPVNIGSPFFNVDGSITNEGIRLNNVPPGVIGETFQMSTACTTANCSNMVGKIPPFSPGAYIPGLVNAPSTAVPTCGNSNLYQEAIAGCDQTTTYQCGTANGTQADLTMNPGGAAGDTSTATHCLIHDLSGPDTMDYTVFPFQMSAGAGNPVITSGLVSISNSIVTVPIFDSTVGLSSGVQQPSVTVVGFLQVFIDNVVGTGNINLHVLNVAGCGSTATNPAVNGSSPVPVRLITPQ